MYAIVYTKTALKDISKLKAAHLDRKAKILIAIIRRSPYQAPPPYEKLIGNLKGFYSRRTFFLSPPLGSKGGNLFHWRLLNRQQTKGAGQGADLLERFLDVLESGMVKCHHATVKKFFA